MSTRRQARSRATVNASHAELRREPGWEDRRCRGVDPERFYVRDGEHWTSVYKRLRVTAEEFCRSCPVIEACRAAGDGDPWGMWGGLVRRRDTRSKRSGVVDLLVPDERQRAG